MRDEIPSGDDTAPSFGVRVEKGHPPIMLGTMIGTDFGQYYMPLSQRKGYDRWRRARRGHDPEAIEPDQGEPDLDIGRIHSQAEIAAILCQAIEILRGIAATIELPDCRE